MHLRTAAYRASIERSQCCADDVRVDQGVGIQKQQAFALRGLRAGVTRRGDVAQLHLKHLRTMAACDVRSGVFAGIGDHNHFVVQLHGLRAGMQALQRVADQSGFVMGGNHEGQHGAWFVWTAPSVQVAARRGCERRRAARPARDQTRAAVQVQTDPSRSSRA